MREKIQNNRLYKWWREVERQGRTYIEKRGKKSEIERVELVG